MNRNATVTGADSLAVINAINAFGAGSMPRPGMICNAPNVCYEDVNGDDNLTAQDSLFITNYINAGYSSQPQAFSVGGGDAVSPADLNPMDVTATVTLQVTNVNGTPVTSVKVGQEFKVLAYLVLAAPDGIQPFAGYADLAFTSNLVAPVNSPSDLGTKFSTSSSGLIDEAGRIVYNESSAAIFSKTFIANKKGTATFIGDAADLFGHEIYVTGLNDALPWSQVTFGSTTLTIK